MFKIVIAGLVVFFLVRLFQIVEMSQQALSSTNRYSDANLELVQWLMDHPAAIVRSSERGKRLVKEAIAAHHEYSRTHPNYKDTTGRMDYLLVLLNN